MSKLVNLQALWYTPLPAHGKLRTEEAASLATLEQLRGIVLSFSILSATTAAVLARRCRCIAADSHLGPHGCAYAFDISEGGPVNWDTRLAIYRGARLVRPIDFPFDLL